MTSDQILVLAILGVTMCAFAWGRWRYDVIAVAALLAAVALGVVGPETAFEGFGHPAVITVVAVLLISEALRSSGVVDHLSRLLVRTHRSPRLQISAAAGLTAVLSAFMNNIGALALMLPVAMRNAQRSGISVSRVLMPLSFGSLLGGLVTLIGTPPNIVIAAIRAESTGEPFGMFDFAPVGLPVAVVGILFVSLVGPALIPRGRDRSAAAVHEFELSAYVTEGYIEADSPLIGEPIRHLTAENQEISVIGILRDGGPVLAPRASTRLRALDTLLLQGDAAATEAVFSGGAVSRTRRAEGSVNRVDSDDVRVYEVVVLPHSRLEGQSADRLRLAERYGVNLLALARKGLPPTTRLKHVRIRTGDVLLVQGERHRMGETLETLSCLPLADRQLVLGRRKMLGTPLLIFAAAILAAATGVASIPIAFLGAVLGLIVFRILSLGQMYNAVEWPIVVMLAALIPIGHAIQSTGLTAEIGNAVARLGADLPLWMILTMLLGVSMLLSDLVHNTPTAVIMGPLAVGIAEQIGAPVDPCLMAVAIGAASPYLTPVGHQSNLLVMGPGGYRFTDYMRLGIPLDLIIVVVAVPMLVWVWG